MENEDDKAGGSVGTWEHFGGSGKQKSTRPLSHTQAPVRIVCVGGCVRLTGCHKNYRCAARGRGTEVGELCHFWDWAGKGPGLEWGDEGAPGSYLGWGRSLN